MDADPAGNSILFDLLLLLFFTLMNAFFAGAEMAVVSVNKNRIRSLAQEGNRKAKVIEKLFDDSTKFLSTIQVAITFAGFYSSASAAAGISPALAQWLRGFDIPYSQQIAHNGVTLILMFFNLVFGELVPKRIALQKAESFCMLTVMPIHYVSIILSPFIKLLSVSTKLVLRLLGMKTEDQEEAVTEEEIKALLKMGNESGTFDDEEREMIDSVFAFDDRTAREIMVPRRDVVTIDIEEPFDELIDEILETRHNRIPVYEESIDNIIGVLHVKDVMIELRRSGLDKINIREMLHKPFFVPETKEADELFRTMQAERHHMAILVDEYGGFSGIVTIEDLVEEIMGDINEEYEEVVPEIEAVSENEYVLDGGILIEDLNEELGLKLETENYDTLSGYLIEQLGHIPAKEDRDVIREDNLVFNVMEVKDNRITRVELQIEQQPEEEQVLPGENAIVFSASERKTLDEQFRELDERLQRYYVEIVQYAMAQEGSKQYKNVRYEEYKIRKTRLVRLQIKRGTVVCEFILLNEDFKNYIQDNKVRIRQAPTVLRVEDEAAVAIAKNSIDIAVRAAEDELEYKKQKRREKRRQARQREDTQEG